jgi:hypothetical protein
MKVMLDNTPLEVTPDSVADALIAGRDAAEAAGRLVIEVHADGSPLPVEMLDEPPTDNAGFTEIKLISTRPGPFIQTTLLDASDLLVEIRKAQAQAVESFQTGHIEDGVPALQHALGSWTLIRDVVEKATTLCRMEPSTVVVPTAEGSTRTGATYIDGLAHDFELVRLALEKQDFTALADVLEGELDTQAEAWMDFLKAMAAHAAEEPDDQG